MLSKTKYGISGLCQICMLLTCCVYICILYMRAWILCACLANVLQRVKFAQRHKDSKHLGHCEHNLVQGWCRVLRHPHGSMGSLGLVGSSLGHRWVTVGSSLGHRWVIVGSSLGWCRVLRRSHGCMGPLGRVGSSLGHRWVIVRPSPVGESSLGHRWVIVGVV